MLYKGSDIVEYVLKLSPDIKYKFTIYHDSKYPEEKEPYTFMSEFFINYIVEKFDTGTHEEKITLADFIEELIKTNEDLSTLCVTCIVNAIPSYKKILPEFKKYARPKTLDALEQYQNYPTSGQ